MCGCSVAGTGMWPSGAVGLSSLLSHGFGVGGPPLLWTRPCVCLSAEKWIMSTQTHGSTPSPTLPREPLPRPSHAGSWDGEAPPLPLGGLVDSVFKREEPHLKESGSTEQCLENPNSSSWVRREHM